MRSGSSWLLHVLNQHPEVRMLIENRAIEALHHEVFHSYWSANWEWECPPAELRARAVEAARGLMCTLFPTRTPVWGMKLLSRGRPWEFVRDVFPGARYIHLTRCPTTALPSMTEFVGAAYDVWRDIEHCQAEFVDSHREALLLPETGVPYLRVRQEDIAACPQQVWDEVTRFCCLAPIPVPGLGDEINTSRSTRGRVRDGRPPLTWSEVSADVRDVARRLGYLEAVPSSSEGGDELVAALQGQVEQLTRARVEWADREAELQRENRRLALLLRQSAPELDAQPTLPDVPGVAPTGAPAASSRRGSGRAAVLGVCVLDRDGQPCSAVPLGDSIVVEVRIEARAALDHLSVSFRVCDELGREILGTTTFDERYPLPPLSPGESLALRFQFLNHLRPGVYGVSASVNRVSQRDYSDNELLDQREDVGTFSVPRDPERPVHYAVHEPIVIDLLGAPSVV